MGAVPNVDDNSLSSASSILEEMMAWVVGSMTAGEHSVSVLNRAVPSSDKEKVSDSAVRQPRPRAVARQGLGLGPAAPASAPPRSGSENVIPTPLPSCSCRAAAEMRVREA